MRKVTIVLPDDKMALVEELVKAITDMEIVEVKDMGITEEFQRKSPKERLDFAIHIIVEEEGLLTNRYDFAWLYATIQEELLKGIKMFHSVESFRLYLISIGIKKVPSNSTISDRFGCLRHNYPNWTFSDNCDAKETQRRINIAKRFLSLFFQGK